MKKITLEAKDFEKELEKLDFDLQKQIKIFRDAYLKRLNNNLNLRKVQETNEN